VSDDPAVPDGDATEIEGSLEFSGRAGDIVGLVIKNALLNIITLGFYRFWGRTNVRRYLWAKAEVFAAPLEYTGTGKELFVGFLLIVVLVFVPYAGLNIALESTGLLHDATAAIVYNNAVALVILYLIGVATYRARRYRLTRTRWRSIRLGQIGSSWTYGLWHVGLNLAMILFGLIMPYKNMKLWRIKIRNTHVGNNFFRFDANGTAKDALKKLYLRFLVPGTISVVYFFIPMALGFYQMGIFLSENEVQADDLNDKFVPYMSDLGGVLGAEYPMISMVFSLSVPVAFIGFFYALIWYKLHETRALVELTTFENLELKFRAGVWSYVWLSFSNLLILILTLGFGLPFTQLRYARWVCRYTQVDGKLDLAEIAQSLDDDLTSGEGLAEAFDMGAV